MGAMREICCHIAGERVAGTGEAFSSVNPATGDTIAQGRAAALPEIERAIEAARRARVQWLAMGAAERGRVLGRVATILRERKDELAQLEVREPLGICAGIGAWNYPIQIASWKTAPALAAGNAMLFKPSEMTPLTAIELGRIVEEAGAPPGLMCVLPGGRETGEILSTHEAIAKISVTGSVPTGKAVMAAAAGTLKHVTMELGGKSALVVFADADLDDAVSAAMLANFYTQGEICTNGTRVFVERPIYEAFLEKAKARAEAIIVGDPTDPETQMGPLIAAHHLDKVMGYVDAGIREGARLVTGGKRLVEGDLAAGNYMQPTIFADVLDEMTISREEIFGPVMSVLPTASPPGSRRASSGSTTTI